MTEIAFILLIVADGICYDLYSQHRSERYWREMLAKYVHNMKCKYWEDTLNG